MASSQAEGGKHDRRVERIGIIDLGSNTARLVVLELRGGELHAIAGDRAALKLMRAVDGDGILAAEAMDRVRQTLGRFIKVANSSGAQRVIAVATSALRDSVNGPAFLAELRSETGIEIDLIDGETESSCSFEGAISKVEVDDGMVLDIGGGSLELVQFRDRRLEQHWMVPLGALRLSDRFLRSDPPAPAEIKALLEYVETVLVDLGLAKLKRRESLVGTGGTIRNVAAMCRAGGRHVGSKANTHIGPADLGVIALKLVAVDSAARAAIPGLSHDRADSIVGGTLTMTAVMAALGARRVTVSPAGLREGVALRMLGVDRTGVGRSLGGA